MTAGICLEYLEAWLVTIALEVPVVSIAFPGQRIRMALVCLVATTLTHAAMHFLLPPFVSSIRAWTITGEAGALMLEAAVYAVTSRPRSPGRALIASALSNSLSYGAGVILFG